MMIFTCYSETILLMYVLVNKLKVEEAHFDFWTHL